MEKNKKEVVIIIGPPGAGKGTQAELLSDRLGFFYFETSKIIESNVMDSKDDDFVEIENKKYYFKKEKDFWKNGMLCSPPFVTYLVKKEIKKLHEKGENILLAGSPRTLYESQKINPFLEDLYGKDSIKLFLISLKPEQSIFRNSNRRICELIRHPILYNEETKDLTICPLDGSKLLKRKGLDDPETIKVRLKEYEERTLPIIDYFRKEGIKIIDIDGNQSVADVFKDILKGV